MSERKDLESWIYNYNAVYPHSALNYKTPLQAEEDYYRLEKEESLETQQIFVWQMGSNTKIFVLKKEVLDD